MGNKSGSACLVLVGILSILVIYMHISLRMAAHIRDIAHMRAQSAQYSYMAEGALIYGVLWCKQKGDQLEELCKKYSTYEIYNGDWPWMKAISTTAKLTVTSTRPDIYQLETFIYKERKMVHKRQRIVVKKQLL